MKLTLETKFSVQAAIWSALSSYIALYFASAIFLCILDFSELFCPLPLADDGHGSNGLYMGYGTMQF